MAGLPCSGGSVVNVEDVGKGRVGTDRKQVRSAGKQTESKLGPKVVRSRSARPAGLCAEKVLSRSQDASCLVFLVTPSPHIPPDYRVSCLSQCYGYTKDRVASESRKL